jgi:hypothetical protein
MSELNSRKLGQFIFATFVMLITCAGELRAQSVVITPDRLREGDGLTRNITVEASVETGAQLSVSVSYSSDPNAANTGFIPKFSVQDNVSGDIDPREGKIRLVLPKPFDKTGVYLIAVDKPAALIKLVYEPNNPSYVHRVIDWLVTAAGGAQRGAKEPTARERIEDLTKNKKQDSFAVWTVALPAAGQPIDPESAQRKIPAAVMPSWSRSGNYVTCSTWRNGRWVISAFVINRMGVAVQSWQWNPRSADTIDFSPAWSPGDDAIAFVRVTPDQKSDIWILRLDRNHKPQKEIKVTDIGNVQAVLGWDKDLGLVFETKSRIESSTLRQVWAMSVTAGGALSNSIALPDAYNSIRGSAPLRGTVIYARENDGIPKSELSEVDSGGKRWTLMLDSSCWRRWPAVSRDEKWLAFDYGCPN